VVEKEKIKWRSRIFPDYMPRGGKERTIFMFIRICRIFLRFFERWMMRAQKKRLEKMMNEKK